MECLCNQPRREGGGSDQRGSGEKMSMSETRDVFQRHIQQDFLMGWVLQMSFISVQYENVSDRKQEPNGQSIITQEH